MAPALAAFARELGIAETPSPAPARDRFDAQYEAVLRARPRAFSFTFGGLQLIRGESPTAR